jgi:hypothetical protein
MPKFDNSSTSFHVQKPVHQLHKPHAACPADWLHTITSAAVPEEPTNTSSLSHLWSDPVQATFFGDRLPTHQHLATRWAQDACKHNH